MHAQRISTNMEHSVLAACRADRWRLFNLCSECRSVFWPTGLFWHQFLCSVRLGRRTEQKEVRSFFFFPHFSIIFHLKLNQLFIWGVCKFQMTSKKSAVKSFREFLNHISFIWELFHQFEQTEQTKTLKLCRLRTLTSASGLGCQVLRHISHTEAEKRPVALHRCEIRRLIGESKKWERERVKNKETHECWWFWLFIVTLQAVFSWCFC